MARNGSGTYSNPYPNFVSGTVISSDEVDANNSDIATALTQSIAVDGQSTVTGNIPLSTNKLTGVGAGSAATDSLNLGQAQAEAFIWCGTAGGSADAITLSPSPAITAYAAGQRFVWMASGSVNTGATTVAISGLGAIALQDNGAALVAGNHAASKMFMGILNTTSTVQIMQVQISGTDPLLVSSLTVSGDALIGDDLRLDSDDAVLSFGADNEITLTHLHNTGLLLNSALMMTGTAAVQFYDTSQSINAPSSSVLDINATDEVELNATLVDVNANLDVSGTALITGVTTHGGNVVSDTDSTDDLGTTGVRWANLYVDAITASDQITATGFTGTLDGILGSGTAAAASVTTLTTSGIASIDDTTDSSSGTTGSIHTDGGLGVAKSIYANPNVDSTHVLGQLKIGYAFAGSASIAEHGNLSTTNFALNQTSGGQTIINSASGQTLLLAQNGTAIVTYSGGDATHTGAISVDDTTDSTSTTSGSIHTDGGLGVAKDIIAGAAVMVGGNIVTSRSNANGSIEVSHNSGTMETGTASGNADELIIVGAATGANSGMTILSGVAQTGNVFFGDNGDTDIGGITYNHNGNAMTFVTNATTQLTLSSAGLATFVGALSVDDTTDSTSTTTGSIHTDGGLGVAKKLYVAGGMNVTTTGSTSTFTVVNSSTLTVVGTGSSAATNSDLYIDTKGTGSIYLRPGGATPAVTINSAGNVAVAGALSKGSGSFKIDHPLPSLNATHSLVHSFTESPKADLIYRGTADLVSGVATVNIDTAAGMTEGTFVVLCTDVQCFTSNEDGWTALKGSVTGNVLTITAQDNTCTDTVGWMVIGERCDPHMLETDWTDAAGKVIVEPLQPVPPEGE